MNSPLQSECDAAELFYQSVNYALLSMKRDYSNDVKIDNNIVTFYNWQVRAYERSDYLVEFHMAKVSDPYKIVFGSHQYIDAINAFLEKIVDLRQISATAFNEVKPIDW